MSTIKNIFIIKGYIYKIEQFYDLISKIKKISDYISYRIEKEIQIIYLKKFQLNCFQNIEKVVNDKDENNYYF